MVAFLIFMLIAMSFLAVGTFAALVIRKLKLDVEQENAFRAKLSGVQRSFISSN